jgi:hypothetical protein
MELEEWRRLEREEEGVVENGDQDDFSGESQAAECIHCGSPIGEPRERVEAELCNSCESQD